MFKNTDRKLNYTTQTQESHKQLCFIELNLLHSILRVIFKLAKFNTILQNSQN